VSHVEIDCDGKYVTKESGRYIPPKLVSGKKYWLLVRGADDSEVLSFYWDPRHKVPRDEVVKVLYVGSLNEHEVFLKDSDKSQAVLLTDGDIRNFRVAAAYKQVTYVLCANVFNVNYSVKPTLVSTELSASEQVKKQAQYTDVTCSTVLQWYPSGNIPEGWTPLESNEKTRSTVEVDT
jgi:hypothetical protein